MRCLGIMLAAALGLVPLQARAQSCGNPCVADQLVKVDPTELWYGYYIHTVDPAISIFRCDLVGASHSAGRSANISPLSGDPGPTADPIIAYDGLTPCALDDANGDGSADWNFSLDFRSLHDLGVWTISWQCYQVDPHDCWSCWDDPNCNVCCTPSSVSSAPAVDVFEIEAYNSPPTANITHSGSATWNGTVTFDGHGADDDHPGGSGLSYHWSIASHPPGATATLSGATTATPSIAFGDETAIGHWAVHLDLDDLEGERVTPSDHSFDVPNEPPTLTIDPPSPIVMDAMQRIAPTARSDDPDRGPAPAVVWDIISSPPGASVGPVSNYVTGPAFTPIVTGKRDIGEWVLHVTATDNEGPSATPPGVTSEDVTVTVRNLPPRIELEGSHAIRVGDSIHAETTVTTDDFGDPLLFSWEVVQVPHSAGMPLHTVLSTSASLDLATTTIDAGTWIFKLTVTEQGVAEGVDPPSTAEDTFLVLVDDDPTARVTVSAAGGIAGDDPPIVSTSAFPLTLDGSSSEDPDSPCPEDPNHCHDTDTPPADVSPGIVSYVWTLIDVSPELYDRYPLGRVDEVFGLDGTSAQLVFQAFDLEPGDYTFQLDVWDGEDNQATVTQQVSVLAVNGPPVAVLSPPDRYETSGGVLDRDIVVSGEYSFDLDNLLTGGSMEPGLGIADYQWEATPPPGCAAPALPSGPGASSFTLYAAGGSAVPDECVGAWELQLTVGDDDTPQLHGVGNTFVVIGSCPVPLCIDRPKTLDPKIIDFTEQTDVTVVYHLDSAVYDDPAYVYGAFTLLEIFNAADLTRPFYASLEPNALASNRGSFLAFNWDGYGTGRVRPPAGMYSVSLTVQNYALGSGPFTASEPLSIWIAVADLQVLDTSTRFADQDALAAGTASLHFDYSISGGVTVEQLHWRVFDASSTLVYEHDAPAMLSGTIDWDGVIGGVPLGAGDYTFELEARRGGASLGKSAAYPFTVYRLRLLPTAPATAPLVVMVNSDDDDRNGASDLTQSPAAAGENDLASLDFDLMPAIPGDLELSSSVMPAPIRVWTGPDKATEVVLPHTYHVPADTLPAALYVEGSAPGAAELVATLTPTGGTPLPERRVSISTAELLVMLDTNSDFVPDAQAQFVRVGLWDSAFRLAGDAFGAQGTLYNEQDDVRLAASGHPENFAGQDSRSFFLEIRDPARNADPAVAEEIPASDDEWYTLHSDGTDDDHPAVNGLTFVETGPDTGVFRTRAVELVTGQLDRDQATNSGTAAHPGLQAYDATDHRTRQVTAPDGRMVLRYQPAVAGSPKLSINPPLFQRTPEERRVATFHFFNFSDTPKGVAAVPTAQVETQIRQLQERAVVLGIRANVLWNPATDILDLPPGSPVDLNNVGSFTGGLGTLAPSADETLLINQVRGVDPAGPGNADTLYVLVIRNSANLGESFPDGWIPGGSAATNFTFMAGMAANNDFTAAHETICHMLINQTLTAAEANGTAAGWAPGGHYGGPAGAADLDFNMCAQIQITSMPVAITDGLRLWDDAGHLLQQITRARSATRYLKNP